MTKKGGKIVFEKMTLLYFSRPWNGLCSLAGARNCDLKGTRGRKNKHCHPLLLLGPRMLAPDPNFGFSCPKTPRCTFYVHSCSRRFICHLIQTNVDGGILGSRHSAGPWGFDSEQLQPSPWLSYYLMDCLSQRRLHHPPFIYLANRFPVFLILYTFLRTTTQ